MRRVGHEGGFADDLASPKEVQHALLAGALADEDAHAPRSDQVQGVGRLALTVERLARADGAAVETFAHALTQIRVEQG